MTQEKDSLSVECDRDSRVGRNWVLCFFCTCLKMVQTFVGDGTLGGACQAVWAERCVHWPLLCDLFGYEGAVWVGWGSRLG